MEPWLQTLAVENKGKIKFVKVDVDRSRDVGIEYEADSIPLIVIIKNGKESARVVGSKKDKIKSMIEAAKE